MGLAAQVKQTIQNGGVAITDVDIVDATNRATWKVRPASLQSAAQPFIDGFVIATGAALELSTIAQATSRQKDLLATLAVIVRVSNVTAWNGMTNQQRVDATLVEADRWKTFREWIDDKV